MDQRGCVVKVRTAHEVIFTYDEIDIGLSNNGAFSDRFEQECQSDGVWVDSTCISFTPSR